MDDKVLDSIVDNLLFVHTLTHRKLFKVDFETLGKDISRPHLAIMKLLQDSGSLPVSEIGKRLSISKPQMTHLVDRLIRARLVKRFPDVKDRRVIHIGLTGAGEKVLEQFRVLVKENLRNKLSLLDDKEVEELSASLQTFKNLGSRLE
ncbi:MAG: MarR family transcriptional regulator [Chloroflexi bacterium]|nr:MarR family transcriptional regulator [Chloroflexota bacterium]